MSEHQEDGPRQFTIFDLSGSIGAVAGLTIGANFGLRYGFVAAFFTALIGTPVGLLTGFYGSLFFVSLAIRLIEYRIAGWNFIKRQVQR